MGRKLIRILVGIAVVEGIAVVIGQVLAKKLSKGDETTDDFQVAAILGGKAFKSKATAFKSGSVTAKLGGIQLDLREATLDPAGADLELNATLGGIAVYVPEGWAIEVESDVQGGDVKHDLTPIEDLPEDAPHLRIHAVTHAGGVVVEERA